MFENVYRAAVDAGVPLVIMASSVHADAFYDVEGSLKPDDNPHPDSPYGAEKVFMEKLGEWYSKEHGLGVICLRLGGVNPQNKPPEVMDPTDKSQARERSVWLDQNDLAELIEAILESNFNGFAIVYAISDNEGRIQDISNPFGWIPRHSTERFS